MEEVEPLLSREVETGLLRRLISLAWVALLGAAAGCGAKDDPGHAREETERLNLLLVTLDTTRADALSCYGGPPGTTPNLDRIAREGCRFVQGYSASNATNPSHLSLLSGLHALDHGVLSNFGRPAERRWKSLPSVFRSLGYTTAGFPAAAHLAEVMAGDDWTHFETGPEVLESELLAHEMSDRFLGWLQDRGEEPFLAWLHFFDPHANYTPPDDIGRRFYPGDPRAGDRPLFSEKPYFDQVRGARLEWIEGVRDEEWPWAMYLGEVHFVDREFGRILAELERRELYDRTVIVVVGDHGEAVDHHELLFTHSGLWEDTLRVPFLIRVPGLPPGIEWEGPVTHLDILPTVLELFGVEPETPLPGRSLLAVLRGKKDRDLAADRAIFFEAARNNQIAVRRGSWKLIWTQVTDHRRLSPEPLLFDLAADPGETTNLFDQRPDIVSELRPLVSRWIEKGVVPRLRGLPKEEILKRLEALGYTR